jgi:hypothetical protein
MRPEQILVLRSVKISYSLFWNTPALPWIGKQNPINVPAGSVVSNASSLRFTGKGAANYGKIQQENLMRLLENFAGPTAPPFPTVGQNWYDTTNNVLNICVATAPSPITWQTMKSTQIGDLSAGPPTPAVLGDMWYARTGVQSGVLFTYTGVGRYPTSTFDAVAAGYYPATNTTTLAAKINETPFNVVAYSKAYICGRSAGTPADINGTILIGSTPTTVPRGSLVTSKPSTNAFILWDSLGALGPANAFYQVRQRADEVWVYDDGTTWTTLVPTTGQYAIGQITVTEQADNTAPGIASALVWTVATLLTQINQTDLIVSNGKIGGWDQIWPPVSTHAGREEYKYVLNLLLQLIGEPLNLGGAGALDTYITYLTPIKALDASKQLAWTNNVGHDLNVLDNTNLNLLIVSPNSQDWDKLLSACRYAVSRLELPPNFSTSLSSFPFVQDGFAYAPELSTFTLPDPRAAPLVRKANNPVGSITLLANYQSTVNTLAAAIQNRYILKGMLGVSGVNPTFNPEVTVALYAQYSANALGSVFTSPITTGVKYDFTYTTPQTQQFFYAGQAVELIAVHAPAISATAADTNLKALTDAKGRFRVTADAVYIMDGSATPGVSVAPISNSGYKSITTAGVTLATVSGLGGAQLTLRAALSTIEAGSVIFFLDIVVGGSTTGTFTVKWNWIGDGTSVSSVRVFPAPLTGSIDKQGSGIFT